MADYPHRTELPPAPTDAPSERAFVRFWIAYTIGLLALLLGISGWPLLMR